MTTEELILGHFDESLTSAEERQLQELLGHSPEARGLFEQHGALQRMLVSDAGTLAPSSRLDDMAIAAALGTAPEVIGGGAAATGWLGGKVAAVVALVAAGGVSIALFSSSGSKAPVPAPSPAPAVMPAPSAAPVPQPAPTAPTTVDAAKATATTAAPQKRAKAEKSGTNDAATSSVVKKSRGARPQRQLSIDTEGTTISYPPKARDTNGR